MSKVEQGHRFRAAALPAWTGGMFLLLAMATPSLAREPRTNASTVAVADSGASLRLARALRSAGDSRSAVHIYKQLVTDKSAPPALRIELGETLLDAGLIDEAIGVFGAVEAGSPDEAEAQLGLARSQLSLNEPIKALAYLARAAALAPTNERVLVGQGVAFDRMGRHKEAQASYRAALAAAPRSVAVRNDLALSLALSGQFDEAIGILTSIARSADASAADRQNLAFIYGLRGDTAAALALSRIDLDEATAQNNARFFAVASEAAR